MSAYADSLRAGALRTGRLMQLEAQGFIGGELKSARGLRGLLPRRKQFEDVTVLQIGDADPRWEDEQPEVVVVSRDTFATDAPIGPTTIVRRDFTPLEADPASWITTRFPMLDGDAPVDYGRNERRMWAILSGAESKSSLSSMDQLAERLDRLSAEDAGRFADWVSRMLHQLDHPALARESADSDADSAGLSLALRGDILARGMSTYDRFVRAPHATTRLNARRGRQLLDAVRSVVPQSAWEYEVQTGSNDAEWRPAEWARGRSARPSVFSASEQRRILRIDPWQPTSIYGFVGYAHTREQVTEFRGAAVAESIAEARAWAVLYLHDQIDSDDRLYPSLLVWRTGFGHISQHLPILISRWSGYQSMAELIADQHFGV